MHSFKSLKFGTIKYYTLAIFVHLITFGLIYESSSADQAFKSPSKCTVVYSVSGTVLVAVNHVQFKDNSLPVSTRPSKSFQMLYI